MVVTGATTGVGRGVACALAAPGAHVVLAARRRKELDELRMAAMSGPQAVVEAVVRSCIHPRRWQPVGFKARAALFAARIAPAVVDRVSARVADVERRLGAEVPATAGALHEPSDHAATVTGGVRPRMRRETISWPRRAFGR